MAFESMGAKCVFSAEIDKHACATYKAIFGDDPYCDVSQLDPMDMPNLIFCVQVFHINLLALQGRERVLAILDEIRDNPLLLAYEIRKSRCTFRYDNLAPTLTAKMGTGGNNVPVLVNQMRKLTTPKDSGVS